MVYWVLLIFMMGSAGPVDMSLPFRTQAECEARLAALPSDMADNAKSGLAFYAAACAPTQTPGVQS